MANPTIIIDAGHGGFDNGASDNGRLEKDDNLRLALAVGERLSAAGFPVVYTRTEDIYQRPIDKARIANDSGGDYFVSFHRNASPERNTYSGVQTLVYADEGVKAALARNINNELNNIGFNDLGVPERKNLVVLKRTNMPAVLIETGFINTDADNQLFDERFNDIADGIARAIEETVGDNTVDNQVDNTGAATGGATGADSGTTGSGNSRPAQSANRQFGVQVGLFRRYGNARYLASELAVEGFYVQIIEQEPYYAVVVGREDSLDDASELEMDLKRRGYDTLLVNL